MYLFLCIYLEKKRKQYRNRLKRFESEGYLVLIISICFCQVYYDKYYLFSLSMTYLFVFRSYANLWYLLRASITQKII